MPFDLFLNNKSLNAKFKVEAKVIRQDVGTAGEVYRLRTHHNGARREFANLSPDIRCNTLFSRNNSVIKRVLGPINVQQ